MTQGELCDECGLEARDFTYCSKCGKKICTSCYSSKHGSKCGGEAAMESDAGRCPSASTATTAATTAQHDAMDLQGMRSTQRDARGALHRVREAPLAYGNRICPSCGSSDTHHIGAGKRRCNNCDTEFDE